MFIARTYFFHFLFFIFSILPILITFKSESSLCCLKLFWQQLICKHFRVPCTDQLRY